MSEKKGHTEKIKYNFNTASNLESFIPNLKQWIRQTSREFRSSSYKRRINGEEYFGPVYEYDTNRLVSIDKQTNCIESYNYRPSKREFGN